VDGGRKTSGLRIKGICRKLKPARLTSAESVWDETGPESHRREAACRSEETSSRYEYSKSSDGGSELAEHASWLEISPANPHCLACITKIVPRASSIQYGAKRSLNAVTNGQPPLFSTISASTLISLDEPMKPRLF
jgi:hypothetical protein